MFYQVNLRQNEHLKFRDSKRFWGIASLPFGFLTPFSVRSSRRLRNAPAKRFENTQAFYYPSEGRMVRRSCEGLSGHGSSTEGRGERSLEPSRFWLAGAKAAYLRANLPELFKRFSHRLASAGILFKSELRRLNPQWSLRLSPKIFGYSESNLLSQNLGCILRQNGEEYYSFLSCKVFQGIGWFPISRSDLNGNDSMSAEGLQFRSIVFREGLELAASAGVFEFS